MDKNKLRIPGIAKLIAAQGFFNIKNGFLPKKQIITKYYDKELTLSITRSESLNIDKLKKVANIYNNLKKFKNKRSENTIQLIGGRDFGRRAVLFLKNSQ